jgi:signal transduction histidine kinase
LWWEPGPKRGQLRRGGEGPVTQPRTRSHRFLDLLHQVSEALDRAIDPEVAAWSVLVALTAGEGLAFNRAFLLLAEDDTWRGFFCVGPQSREEARELWADLRRKGLRPLDTLDHPDLAQIQVEKSRHQETLDRLGCPISKSCSSWTRPFVARSNNERDCVRHWMSVLDSQHLAVVPLTTEDHVWGVVLADNFVTHQPIGYGALETTDTMAHSLRGALERTRLVARLHEERRRRTEAEHATTLIETARSLAHDLKNPLALAGGLATELASAPPADHHALQRRLEIIRGAVQRAEERVAELADGLASRAHTMRLEAVEVGRLANGVTEAFRALAATRGVRLLCYHPARDVLAVAAVQPLERCLENLLGNALQAFGKTSGEIQIAVGDDEQWVRVEVADNGPPLLAALRDRPFAGGVSTRRGGSGLGLASVRSLVEAMGGRVEYDERDAGWVRFTLYLRRWL